MAQLKDGARKICTCIKTPRSKGPGGSTPARGTIEF